MILMTQEDVMKRNEMIEEEKLYRKPYNQILEDRKNAKKYLNRQDSGFDTRGLRRLL